MSVTCSKLTITYLVTLTRHLFEILSIQHFEYHEKNLNLYHDENFLNKLLEILHHSIKLYKKIIFYQNFFLIIFYIQKSICLSELFCGSNPVLPGATLSLRRGGPEIRASAIWTVQCQERCLMLNLESGSSR